MQKNLTKLDSTITTTTLILRPNITAKSLRHETYDDRLETLENVRKSGMKVCCGGIVGMGESQNDRVGLLTTLANLSPPPESVPITI